MAKSMMFENVVVLELLQKSTDKDGKPLTNKEGKAVSYNTLVCYEFGNKYPELLKLSVHPDKLSDAQSYVGKRANLIAGVSVYQDKMSLHFNEGHIISK